MAYVKQTTQTAVELFAKLCKFHGPDPLAPGVIVSHAEGDRLGIATDHGDPEHLWRGLGMDYNMDKFIAAVAAEMEDGMTKEQVLEIIKEYEANKTKQSPGSWSQADREWAEQNGVITGFGNGKMGYQGEMMAAFLHRLWKVVKAYIDGKVG